MESEDTPKQLKIEPQNTRLPCGMLCYGTEAVPVEGGGFHMKSVYGHSGQVEHRMSKAEVRNGGL